jgi:hypothetical protein
LSTALASRIGGGPSGCAREQRTQMSKSHAMQPRARAPSPSGASHASQIAGTFLPTVYGTATWPFGHSLAVTKHRSQTSYPTGHVVDSHACSGCASGITLSQTSQIRGSCGVDFAASNPCPTGHRHCSTSPGGLASERRGASSTCPIGALPALFAGKTLPRNRAPPALG